jgi:nucleotidyltransferase/DNA polymerase involved in DNA repair
MLSPTAPTAPTDSPYLACVSLAPSPRPDAPWLDACYRLTPRVERVSICCALLDLGPCSHEEARHALRTLLSWLAEMDLAARAGIGPSLTLAQLAALRATVAQPLVLITPAVAPAFLRSVPVAALAALHPRAAAIPAAVARLRRYGLYTLGHVARLGEPALRRHFGAAVGTFLAAVARGRDPYPLRPTPPARTLRFHLPFMPAADPSRVLAALPDFAARIAAHLGAHDLQTGALSLRLRWESGAVGNATNSLSRPLHATVALAQHLQRLAEPLLQPSGAAHTVAALDLTLARLTPAYPEQAPLWQLRLRARRLAAVAELADTLARRHGHPLLLHPRLAARDAIFPEDCYHLVPLIPDDDLQVTQPARVTAAAPDAWDQVPQRLHWW